MVESIPYLYISYDMENEPLKGKCSVGCCHGLWIIWHYFVYGHSLPCSFRIFCIHGKQYNPPQALLNPPGVLLEILRYMSIHFRPVEKSKIWPGGRSRV